MLEQQLFTSAYRPNHCLHHLLNLTCFRTSGVDPGFWNGGGGRISSAGLENLGF